MNTLDDILVKFGIKLEQQQKYVATNEGRLDYVHYQ